jgi:uncharacterized protein YigE (DUF2233 family)
MTTACGYVAICPAADGQQDDQHKQHVPVVENFAEHPHGMTFLDGKMAEVRQIHVFRTFINAPVPGLR